MTKLLRILKILLKAKYTFNEVPQNNLLIYDSLTLEIVKNKLPFTLLRTRKEYFNLRLIIKNFFFLKFSFISYLESFIKAANPKLVITLNDNEPLFYELKKRFPEKKFAAVQNGWRHLNDESFKSRNLPVDYLFVFGKNSIRYYKKYIRCKKYIILGSFRNNNCRITKKKSKKGILFISNFRKNFLSNFNNDFKIEPQIIQVLNNFCQYNKIKFYIAGTSIKNSKLEKKYFFSKLPKKNNGIMLKRNKNKRNYNLVDEFSTIMFVDSSLGYEAISRGKKIISISARKKNNRIYHPFGFPTFFSKNSGQFYTNLSDKKNILELLKRVYNMSSVEWNKKYYNNLKELVVYNYKNVKLYSTLNQILK